MLTFIVRKFSQNLTEYDIIQMNFESRRVLFMGYLQIGSVRLLDIKVVREDKTVPPKENGEKSYITLYDGMVEDAPEEIKKMSYVGILAGTKTTFEVE